MPEIRPKLYRGWWYAVWYDDEGGTKRRALRTKDSAEAERRILDLKRDMAAPAGSLVGDVIQAYLDEKKGRIASHERLEFAWERAKPVFAHLRPDQITRTVCRGYIDMRRLAGAGDATILKEINVVRQGLNWRGVTGAKFEAPSSPPPRDNHLTKAQFKKLLDACKQPHVRLFCELALATAGRKTALLQLTWDRVDFERGQIRLGVVGEKNRKGRAIVPMTDRLVKALMEAREAAQTPYVIEYGGEKVGDIKKGFAAAVRRAGLNGTVPHDLRHSAAVWMAEAGISMDEIAQYLGHTSTAITFRVYARFSPTHLRKAASALDF
jgi:integrase